LFDDAGHRMVPTHAAKAGVRYRYYVSTPFLHGEAKTASAGSVSRLAAILSRIRSFAPRYRVCWVGAAFIPD
jgi:hypothetical protein